MPATDFRLYNSFWTRTDVRLLQRAIGPAGVLALIRLHSWTTEHAPSGILPDDADLIEVHAEWSGPPVQFFAAAKAARSLIECAQGLLLAHWREQQDWAASAPERSEAMKTLNRLKNQKKRLHVQAMLQSQQLESQSLSESPSPYPAPSPPSPLPLFDPPAAVSPLPLGERADAGTPARGEGYAPITPLSDQKSSASVSDKAAFRTPPPPHPPPHPPPSPFPIPSPHRSPLPVPSFRFGTGTAGNSERDPYSQEWLAAARVLEKNGWREPEIPQALAFFRSSRFVPNDGPFYDCLAKCLKASQLRSAGQLRGEMLAFVGGKKVGIDDDLHRLARSAFTKELA